MPTQREQDKFVEMFQQFMKPRVLKAIEKVKERGKRLTWGDYLQLYVKSGLNSYERHALLPLLDNQALLQHYESTLPNLAVDCRPRGQMSITYTDHAIKELLPLFAERIKEATTPQPIRNTPCPSSTP